MAVAKRHKKTFDVYSTWAKVDAVDLVQDISCHT